MKYFVTGATGFIGGEVTRQLVAAGHDVVALVRSPEKARPLADLGVTLHQGDITIKEHLRGPMSGVDGVFHIAGWYKIGDSNPREGYHTNVMGTSHVLETMRELGIPKGVYTSSIGVFSNTNGVMPDETYRYTGSVFTNTYERTKWLAHYAVAEPLIKEGLPLVIVLPGVVYGPGDTSMLHEQIELYFKRRLPLVPRKTAFSWVHIEDVARGHLLAMEKGTPGESYILAGEMCSFVDVVKLGKRLTGIPGPRLSASPGMLRRLAAVVGVFEKVLRIPRTYRSESLRTIAGVTYLGSSEKAHRELGFTTRPLIEGLRATADYEQQRLGLRR
jgi:nucleoside-diphosphate-sugar epimerase